jgi:Siphovirus Gp157
MTSLYLLTQEFKAAESKLYDLDLDEQTIIDTLDAMSGELEVKATNTVMVARDMRMTAAAIKEAEAGMAARRKAIEARADALERRVLDSMILTGISKIECPYFNLSVRDNPFAVDIFDSAMLPNAYWTDPKPPEPAPDKTLIKKAINDGFDVPGARLVQTRRLDVK